MSQGSSGFSQHGPKSHLSPPLSVPPLNLHPHTSSPISLHIYRFLFSQLKKLFNQLKKLKLFSLSPRPMATSQTALGGFVVCGPQEVGCWGQRMQMSSAAQGSEVLILPVYEKLAYKDPRSHETNSILHKTKQNFLAHF